MSVIEKYWDDAREGDECISPTYTVTRERILAYADLTGDHTPVHVDEAYANASHFGCLVAHGLFVLPIKVNDVLHVRMRVGAMRPSNSRPGWGIVVLPSELINQHGEVVQRGEHRLMVPRRAAA
ncbi:MaoC family dehydratase [Pseudomonas sp. ER28]|uniref:MaoC family dehydratase n=1 Tax=Pseudomonas sp. ER28 TaxID=3033801 RepID=UPI0023DF34CC|nr:MaoC family dehydratase [Pseudomonas sp. ER28]MDF3175248.1 MaoC family dehydratase [Pseudomonas sp. ER28]